MIIQQKNIMRQLKCFKKSASWGNPLGATYKHGYVFSPRCEQDKNKSTTTPKSNS